MAKEKEVQGLQSSSPDSWQQASHNKHKNAQNSLNYTTDLGSLSTCPDVRIKQSPNNLLSPSLFSTWQKMEAG